LLLIWNLNDIIALWHHGLTTLLLFNLFLFDKVEVIQLVEIVLPKLGGLLLLLFSKELLLGELISDRGANFAARVTFGTRLFLLLLLIVIVFS